MSDTTNVATTQFRVLHAARIKGLANDEVMAALAGISVDTLLAVGAELVESGWLVRREGRFTGYAPTPAGREQAIRLLEADPETAAAAAHLATMYDAFLPANGDFKRICQDWQMRDGAPNDHTDAAYDAGVIGALRALHTGWVPHLESFATTLPRIADYAPRLEHALAKLRGGDNAAFARPMYDSYHDIWMELHQDLIISLGRTRDAHDEG